MRAQMSPEFASLQPTLVDRFVELGMGSYADGVDRLTNFQRRLGVGTPTDPPSNAQWVDLLASIDSARSHESRVDIVMSSSASLPPPIPEHVTRSWSTVGAFSVEVTGNIAHTHFYATDDDDTSALHATKLDTRRLELQTVLTVVRNDHPRLERVTGGSWLYTSASYASLFPAAHVATGVVRRGRQTFRGMSHWGQFLDHRWHLRNDLADRFRHRVRRWMGDDPCALFPIATIEVSSPVAVFDAPSSQRQRS